MRCSTLILPFLIAAMVGCQKTAVTPAAVKPPDVVVDHPTLREVQDAEEFPGRIESVKVVELRAMVTGVLEGIHFEDGKDVTTGQKLFTIDSRVYKAEVERADAALMQMKARLDRVTKDYVRLKGVNDTGAGSKEEFDRVIGDKAEAEAGVRVAEATLNLARTNFNYCTINAPFAGKVSRRNIDPGNMIKANETPLTTIVALDPIYAYFEVDERTHTRVKRLIAKHPSAEPEKTVVGIALADETGFPRTGTIDFVDNQMNAGTGTIRVRAIVENKSKLLTPGLFCRLRYPIGPPHQAVVIPEEAIGSDQGQKYVFVVNEKDEVVHRPVTLGFQVDRLRVIDSGLSTNERIIVKGLQRVRPGIKVTPKENTPPKQAVAGK